MAVISYYHRELKGHLNGILLFLVHFLEVLSSKDIRSKLQKALLEQNVSTQTKELGLAIVSYQRAQEPPHCYSIIFRPFLRKYSVPKTFEASFRKLFLSSAVLVILRLLWFCPVMVLTQDNNRSCEEEGARPGKATASIFHIGICNGNEEEQNHSKTVIFLCTAMKMSNQNYQGINIIYNRHHQQKKT